MQPSLSRPRDRGGHSRWWTIALAAAVCAWVAVGVARIALLERPGLRARFFTSIDWTGDAARSSIQTTLDTAAISRGWGFTPPDAFSVRWSGYIYASQAGEYTFATTSDDGSQVYVDGRLVVDNGGAHGLVTRRGTARLARGPHAVSVTYFNAAGAYAFDWRWSPGDEPLGTIPGWRLSTRPHTRAALILIRIADWLWPLLAVLVMALAAREVAVRRWWPRHVAEPEAQRIALRPALLSLAFFVAVTLAQTWPLIRDPAHLSRNDNADTMLNEWAMAWVAHELPRAPQHLFDANMFYPERHTLAYSEALILQSTMALPLFALGASPVLAYNIVLLAGFTFTGWAMSVLVAAWTDDWIAGAVAGLIVAFNAHTLSRLPHIQAQHVEFLPLALLALDALLRRPRWRTAAWLALWFVLQSLASVYLLVFAAIALTAGFLARPEDWAARRAADVLPKAAIAALIAAAVLVPVLLPYWEVRSAGISRSLDEAGYFAATYRDYLTTPRRLFAWVGGGSALFPGFAALALAAVALLSGRAFRDARARMCLAFGMCGVLLSFGPSVAPGYEFFFSTVPILQPIRTSSRFGYLGIFALAVLAGYGLAALRRVLRARPAAYIAITITALGVAFLDPFAAPIGYERFTGVPSIYGAPARDAHAIVAELPLAPPEFQYRDAATLLHSTSNWRPLVNGYSGFTPPGYVARYIAIGRFPSADSIAALQDLGVTMLFVHTDQYGAREIETLDGQPALRRVAAEGAVTLYTLAPRVR